MIELREVTKSYGAVRAVDDLSLQVRPGECLGLIGPNGAGKTTTIRLVTGLLRPDRGSVSIGGFDLSLHPRQAKQLTGYIPDRPHLYDKLTGREFVRFVGELHGVDRSTIKQRTEILFGLFSLCEAADSLLESYSHGMKQKTVIASALVHEPRALIVDEPMVGLDPKSMRLVKDLLRATCNEKNMALLLSTHSLDVAEEICDRLIILVRGKVVAQGTLPELRKRLSAETNLEAIFLKLTEESWQQ